MEYIISWDEVAARRLIKTLRGIKEEIRCLACWGSKNGKRVNLDSVERDVRKRKNKFRDIAKTVRRC